MNRWIFQGNPTRFNVDAYLLDNEVITWSMRQEHLVEQIDMGDEVFIWRSDGDDKGTGGIVARAEVISHPQVYINSEESAEYWYEDVKDAYLAIYLKVLEVEVENVLKRTDLLEHDILHELPILKIRNNTNYLLNEQLGEALAKEWEKVRVNIQKQMPLFMEEPSNGIVLSIPASSTIHQEFAREMNGIKETDITETEKEQLVKARIGQSSFKKALLAIEKKCKLCGVTEEAFLIASHIKPWSVSTDKERLDPDNGLLLCPNHDRLFDKGFISFLESGQIVVSDSIDDNTSQFMNIQKTMKIKLTDEQKVYMKWHLEHYF